MRACPFQYSTPVMLWLVLLMLSGVASVQAYEENVCGERPHAMVEKELREEARFIEVLMPPIQDQSLAEWCYGFVTADMVNFHNFVNYHLHYRGDPDDAMTPDQYFNERRLLSPVDAVGAHVTHQQSNATYPIGATERGRISTREGGNQATSLRGLQELGFRGRSEAQLPFHTLKDNSDHVSAFIEELLEEFGAGNRSYSHYYKIGGVRCPVAICDQPRFRKRLESLRVINPQLYADARRSGDLLNDYSLSNYQALVSARHGPRDLKIAPFKVMTYLGSDRARAAQMIQQALYPEDGIGRPISVSVCANSIEPDYTDEPCGSHALLLTGAYYENGVCTVRLRNSWGEDWGDQGYLSMALTELFEMLEYQSRFSQRRDRYHFTWIEDSLSSELINVAHEDERSVEGVFDFEYNSPNHISYRVNQTIVYNRAGERVEVHDYPTEEGHRFSGRVREVGRGELMFTEGYVRNSTGKAIYAINIPTPRGRTYTGRVREKNGRVYFLDRF